MSHREKSWGDVFDTIFYVIIGIIIGFCLAMSAQNGQAPAGNGVQEWTIQRNDP